MAEKILNSYETIFIIDATLDEETVTALKVVNGNFKKLGKIRYRRHFGDTLAAFPIRDTRS